MYKNFLKDVIDFYLAIILTVIFFPVILIVYIILHILIGSPIFTQIRPGIGTSHLKFINLKP